MRNKAILILICFLFCSSAYGAYFDHYVQPDSNDSGATDGANARDGNTSTYAELGVLNNVVFYAPTGRGDANTVMVYCAMFNGVSEENADVNIEVYYNGSYKSVNDGAVTMNTWMAFATALPDNLESIRITNNGTYVLRIKQVQIGVEWVQLDADALSMFDFNEVWTGDAFAVDGLSATCAFSDTGNEGVDNSLDFVQFIDGNGVGQTIVDLFGDVNAALVLCESGDVIGVEKDGTTIIATVTTGADPCMITFSADQTAVNSIGICPNSPNDVNLYQFFIRGRPLSSNTTYYTLTYTAGANGSITGTSPQTVESDGNGTAVTAVGNSCYRFLNWSDACDANPRQDTGVTADITVVANFEQWPLYDVVYTADAHGWINSIDNSSYSQQVLCGNNAIAVTAIAMSGYRFSAWSDACDANPRQDINVTGQIEVTANFIPSVWSLWLSVASIAGTITSPPTGAGHYYYDNNEIVEINTVANGGYTFSNWTGSSVAAGKVADANSANTTILMDADYTLHANFTPNPNDWTLTVNDDGNGTATGSGTYTDGNLAPIVATPAEDYYFTVWSGDINSISDINAASTTILMDANYTITANFSTCTAYLARYNSIDGVSYLVDDFNDIPCGTTLEFDATNPDTTFIGWLSTGGASIDDATQSNINVTVTGDGTITAVFISDFYDRLDRLDRMTRQGRLPR